MSHDLPRSALAHVRALIDLHRYDAAASAAADVIASDPSDVEARCLFALALLRADRPDDALRAAEEAVGTDPDSAWAHQLRA